MATRKKEKKESSYKEICVMLLEAIVTKPDQVEITEVEDETGLNMSIKVAQDDIGRVIGKGGKIIKAIRNLLRIRAIKEGKRVNVALVE